MSEDETGIEIAASGWTRAPSGIEYCAPGRLTTMNSTAVITSCQRCQVVISANASAPMMKYSESCTRHALADFLDRTNGITALLAGLQHGRLESAMSLAREFDHPVPVLNGAPLQACEADSRQGSRGSDPAHTGLGRPPRRRCERCGWDRRYLRISRSSTMTRLEFDRLCGHDRGQSGFGSTRGKRPFRQKRGSLVAAIRAC